MNDARRNVNDHKVTIPVLFDLSKPFDTVSHSILLDQMGSLGLTASAIIFRVVEIISFIRGLSPYRIDIIVSPSMGIQ